MILFLKEFNGLVYSWILLPGLLWVSVYFTCCTGAVQLRALPESLRAAREKPAGKGPSSFAALMISTASRVGTGNIVGVSGAICLGGCGAVFWLLFTALLSAAAAFAESTLAQVYKRRRSGGGCYGGPALYMEAAWGKRGAAMLFCLLLIGTHGLGFNLLTAYNLQSSFACFSFYRPEQSPWLIGLLLALCCFAALGRGGRHIEAVTSVLVPIMALSYAALSVLVLLRAWPVLPTLLGEMLRCAFDREAMRAGLAASGLMYGLRRGLFSTEAGMGSSPNAAAAVESAHPVKQGLSQMLSVIIDTLLCLSTAVICLASGALPREELAGMGYVFAAMSRCFGDGGKFFIAVSMALFGFSSLLGNMFYLLNSLRCLFRREPSRRAAEGCRLLISLSALLGCGLSMELVWELSDSLMGLICLLHLPTLWKLRKVVRLCWADYRQQRRRGIEPIFHASRIGLGEGEYWT